MAPPPEDDLPADALKRAWARALRHPNEPIVSHDDPRVVTLPHQIVAQIGLDEREEGRFARVSVRRLRGARLEHEEAVPLVAHVFLAGRFEPFPVDTVVGADQETLHYVLDVEAYKEARALDHVARAARLTGTDASDAEIEIGRASCRERGEMA